MPKFRERTILEELESSEEWLRIYSGHGAPQYERVFKVTKALRKAYNELQSIRNSSSGHTEVS